MIVREHILSSWLFAATGDTFHVNAEGKRLIGVAGSRQYHRLLNWRCVQSLISLGHALGGNV